MTDFFSLSSSTTEPKRPFVQAAEHIAAQQFSYSRPPGLGSGNGGAFRGVPPVNGDYGRSADSSSYASHVHASSARTAGGPVGAPPGLGVTNIGEKAVLSRGRRVRTQHAHTLQVIHRISCQSSLIRLSRWVKALPTYCHRQVARLYLCRNRDSQTVRRRNRAL